MKTLKTLVIINGVTGAIGEACLARFVREKDTIVYGLTRQAVHWRRVLVGKYLPAKTMLLSVRSITDNHDCVEFAQAIKPEEFECVRYVHCIGNYAVELNAAGEFAIQNDVDGDGIDDTVLALSYTAFFCMIRALRGRGLPLKSIIFGGLADRHHPRVFYSWWNVMEKVKEEAIRCADERASFCRLNISSVICIHELQTRPYVFTATDADPRFWLMPYEIAQRVTELMALDTGAFHEEDLFHGAEYFCNGYYADDLLAARKKAELGLP